MVVEKVVLLLVDSHRRLGASLQWVTKLVEINVRIGLLSDAAMQVEGENKVNVAQLGLKRRRN
jgi:hypothetical protein